MLARYLVLQIPGAFVAAVVLSLLVRWGQISETLGWVLFGLWLLKDAAMFPVTRIAFESGSGRHGTEALLGASGVAQQELAPGETGYVRVGPELWRARLEGDHPVSQGAAVRVTAVNDLTLLVVAAAP